MFSTRLAQVPLQFGEDGKGCDVRVPPDVTAWEVSATPAFAVSPGLSLSSGGWKEPLFSSKTFHCSVEDVVHHRFRKLEANFVEVSLLDASQRDFEEFGTITVIGYDGGENFIATFSVRTDHPDAIEWRC